MGEFLLKVFAVFWAIWIAWYLTGGPLRNDATSPFVSYDQNGKMISTGTSTKK